MAMAAALSGVAVGADGSAVADAVGEARWPPAQHSSPWHKEADLMRADSLAPQPDRLAFDSSVAAWVLVILLVVANFIAAVSVLSKYRYRKRHGMRSRTATVRVVGGRIEASTSDGVGDDVDGDCGDNFDDDDDDDEDASLHGDSRSWSLPFYLCCLCLAFAFSTLLAAPLSTLLLTQLPGSSTKTPAEAVPVSRWFSLDAKTLVDTLWFAVVNGSSVCLFVLIPFAYFFEESQDAVWARLRRTHSAASNVRRRSLVRRLVSSLVEVALLGTIMGGIFVLLQAMLVEGRFTWSYPSAIVSAFQILPGLTLFLLATPPGFVQLIAMVARNRPRLTHFRRSKLEGAIAADELEVESLRYKSSMLAKSNEAARPPRSETELVEQLLADRREARRKADAAGRIGQQQRSVLQGTAHHSGGRSNGAVVVEDDDAPQQSGDAAVAQLELNWPTSTGAASLRRRSRSTGDAPAPTPPPKQTSPHHHVAAAAAGKGNGWSWPSWLPRLGRAVDGAPADSAAVRDSPSGDAVAAHGNGNDGDAVGDGRARAQSFTFGDGDGRGDGSARVGNVDADGAGDATNRPQSPGFRPDATLLVDVASRASLDGLGGGASATAAGAKRLEIESESSRASGGAATSVGSSSRQLDRVFRPVALMPRPVDLKLADDEQLRTSMAAAKSRIAENQRMLRLSICARFVAIAPPLMRSVSSVAMLGLCVMLVALVSLRAATRPFIAMVSEHGSFIVDFRPMLHTLFGVSYGTASTLIAIVDITCMIFFVAASINGVYVSHNVHRLTLHRIRPVRGRTKLPKLLLNVAIVQLTSYSLPVAAWILGLGSFDLMRVVDAQYGHIPLLRSWYFVTSYTLAFAAASTVLTSGAARRVASAWFCPSRGGVLDGALGSAATATSPAGLVRTPSGGRTMRSGSDLPSRSLSAVPSVASKASPTAPAASAVGKADRAGGMPAAAYTPSPTSTANGVTPAYASSPGGPTSASTRQLLTPSVATAGSPRS